MRWTAQQLADYESKRTKAVPQPADAAVREVGKGGLQKQILDYCRNQWPPWKVIQARADKRSTIAVGAHDLTIFVSQGRTLLVETKAKGKKPTKEQQIWGVELNKLGHAVFVIHSMEQFMTVVNDWLPRLVGRDALRSPEPTLK